MAAKHTTWVGGTVFAAVILLAGGWQFAVSPAMARADDARAETVTVQEGNTQLQKKLAELEKQYANLDTYKAELAKLNVEVPDAAQLAGYLRQVSTLVDGSGAFLVSVTPGVPVQFIPAAPGSTTAQATETPSPTATASAAPSDSAESAPTPVGAGAAAASGLVAVPVDLTLLGTVQNVTHALAALQGSDQRLLLVTTLTGKGTAAQEATGGRPATAKGDLELNVSGYIYVLQNPASAPAPTDGTTPAPLPQGDGAGATMTGA